MMKELQLGVDSVIPFVQIPWKNFIPFYDLELDIRKMKYVPVKKDERIIEMEERLYGEWMAFYMMSLKSFSGLVKTLIGKVE